MIGLCCVRREHPRLFWRVREQVSGAEAQFVVGFIARAKARAYLRSNGNSNRRLLRDDKQKGRG